MTLLMLPILSSSSLGGLNVSCHFNFFFSFLFSLFFFLFLCLNDSLMYLFTLVLTDMIVFLLVIKGGVDSFQLID